jgi:hypothetical protein
MEGKANFVRVIKYRSILLKIERETETERREFYKNRMWTDHTVINKHVDELR